jgi:hypothetical protein
MQVVVDFVEDSCRVSLSEVTLNGTGIFSTARPTFNPHQPDQQEPTAWAPEHHLDDPSMLNDLGDQRVETVMAQEEEEVQDDEEAMGGKVKFSQPETLAAQDEVQESEDAIVEDQEDWKELPPQDGEDVAPPPAIDSSADVEMAPIPPEDATEVMAQVMQEVAAALEEEVPGEGLADAAQSGLDDQVPQEESNPVADADGGDNAQGMGEQPAEESGEGATPAEDPVEGHGRQPRWSEAEERGSEGNGEAAALETHVEEEAEDQVFVEEGAPVSEEVPVAAAVEAVADAQPAFEAESEEEKQLPEAGDGTEVAEAD